MSLRTVSDAGRSSLLRGCLETVFVFTLMRAWSRLRSLLHEVWPPPAAGHPRRPPRARPRGSRGGGGAREDRLHGVTRGSLPGSPSRWGRIL
eukprot:scaffold8080_cov417-Prasinococcus_capsulatus_cf.AAC.6